MPTPADSGSAFGETRRSLLDALERGEQQLREQAAEIVRRAEERARQITNEADLRAGDLEQQLATMQKEISEARVRLSNVRVSAGVEPSRAAVTPVAVPAIAAEPIPVPRAAAAPDNWAARREPVRPAPSDSAPTPAPIDDKSVEPESTDDSPRETLRALRAALEGTQNRPS